MSLLDLSLCMIVKNEELHLERCLSSVQGIVSEIIIADTGSQDNSLNIAQRYGARIIHVPWENDFAKARNAALKQACCSWILVLDADEELDGWLPDEVSPLLKDKNANGYFIQLISYLSDLPEREFVTDAVCRLFRNDPHIQFHGKIHEEAAQSILELSNTPIPFSSLRIKHYGYLPQEIIRKDKNRRNFCMIEQALIEQPEDSMLQYALGTEYFQSERYEQALELFLPLIGKVPSGIGYVSDLYVKASYALHMTHQLDHAESLLDQGLSLFSDFTDLHEAKAFLLIDRQDYGKAYKSLQLALQAGDVSWRYTSSSGSGTYRTESLAGYVCEKRLLFQDALEHYFQAMVLEPGYLPAWSNCISLCLFAGHTERLAAYLEANAQILTPRHLALLVPALLNAGASDCLEPLLPLCFPDHQGPILGSLYHWLQDERSEAVRLLLELQTVMPGNPLPLSYLWAMSWARSDGSAARSWIEISTNQELTPLAEVQLVLEGGTVRPLSEQTLRHAMQLLVQVGAWEEILRLYRHSGDNLHWSRLPQSLLCGLLKAPARIQKDWIVEFDAKRASSKQADAAEAVFFAAMARTCGGTMSTAWLQDVLLNRPNYPAASTAMAYHYLAKASQLAPHLAAGSLEPGLLVRACLH